MCFQNLDDDIIIKIIYLVQDLRNIRMTCKKYLYITNTYGYIRSIKFGINTSFLSFIILNTQNMRSLKKLTMDSIMDAPSWIPYKWAEHTIFNNCSMGKKQIDPPRSPTLILNIKDHLSSNIIDINWKKIPDLKELYIDTYNCNFKDLVKYCPNLRIVFINLKKKPCHLPENIEKLIQLNTFVTNIQATTTHHFVSPHLEICLLSKQTQFTSVSKHIPLKHLDSMR
jgi:hypothetical protein